MWSYPLSIMKGFQDLSLCSVFFSKIKKQEETSELQHDIGLIWAKAIHLVSTFGYHFLSVEVKLSSRKKTVRVKIPVLRKLTRAAAFKMTPDGFLKGFQRVIF